MKKYKTEFRLQIVNSFLAGDGGAVRRTHTIELHKASTADDYKDLLSWSIGIAAN